MMNKNCAQCGVTFSYNPPQGYPDKRKYCDVCSAKRKVEWDAKQRGDIQNPVTHAEPPVPVVKPGKPEIKAPTGEYQSLVYNKTLCANSYEVGKSGNRFKIYFETIEELQVKIKELKDSGLMVEEIDFKKEAFEGQ